MLGEILTKPSQIQPFRPTDGSCCCGFRNASPFGCQCPVAPVGDRSGWRWVSRDGAGRSEHTHPCRSAAAGSSGPVVGHPGGFQEGGTARGCSGAAPWAWRLAAQVGVQGWAAGLWSPLRRTRPSQAGPVRGRSDLSGGRRHGLEAPGAEWPGGRAGSARAQKGWLLNYLNLYTPPLKRKLDEIGLRFCILRCTSL